MPHSVKVKRTYTHAVGILTLRECSVSLPVVDISRIALSFGSRDDDIPFAVPVVLTKKQKIYASTQHKMESLTRACLGIEVTERNTYCFRWECCDALPKRVTLDISQQIQLKDKVPLALRLRPPVVTVNCQSSVNTERSVNERDEDKSHASRERTSSLLPGLVRRTGKPSRL